MSKTFFIRVVQSYIFQNILYLFKSPFFQYESPNITCLELEQNRLLNKTYAATCFQKKSHFHIEISSQTVNIIIQECKYSIIYLIAYLLLFDFSEVPSFHQSDK